MEFYYKSTWYAENSLRKLMLVLLSSLLDIPNHSVGPSDVSNVRLYLSTKYTAII